MTEKEVLELFDKHGAFLKGHFRLSSGLHSEGYLQCALILQHPEIAEKLSRALAKRFEKEKIDLVIGPALGGITLAYEVARSLKLRGIFAERQDGKMVLRRGFSIVKGEKVLVVEDVITTGGSTKEVIELVKSTGGIVIGVGSIIDRSEGRIDFGVRAEHLAGIKIDTFSEEACPLCRSNVLIVKPGSR
ncbi:MAG: orotate phosphoribosyltransferase [Candidatus Omnitrophica bacterium]|nr:orotate phosphoribosyltransferase [Candidatus Omnitrophota bacterium]